MRYSRQYPDFFIIGAQRSGTTSLYEYLRQHPQLFLSPHKETHFFSRDRVRLDNDLVIHSEKEYLKLFAAHRHTQLLGEASPSYLWHPEVAQRIFAKQPRAKIIAILREPIARAFSQYRMDLADGLPMISFYDLITQDYARHVQVYATGHLYVELGLYATQLERYLKVFRCENILVLNFDDLRIHTRATLKRVAKFLEIEPTAFDAIRMFRVHNRNAIPHSKYARQLLPYRSFRQMYRALVPLKWRRSLREYIFDTQPDVVLDARSREFLRAIYSPDIKKLENMCQISFAEWAQA